MSKFTIYAVFNDPRDGSLIEDEDCLIGWDEGMETYFFQSGYVILDCDEGEEPLIWMGTTHKEYPDLDGFLSAIGNIIKSREILDLYEQLELKEDD